MDHVQCWSLTNCPATTDRAIFSWEKCRQLFFFSFFFIYFFFFFNLFSTTLLRTPLDISFFFSSLLPFLLLISGGFPPMLFSLPRLLTTTVSDFSFGICYRRHNNYYLSTYRFIIYEHAKDNHHQSQWRT